MFYVPIILQGRGRIAEIFRVTCDSLHQSLLGLTRFKLAGCRGWIYR
jgi:hypothetical protein